MRLCRYVAMSLCRYRASDGARYIYDKLRVLSRKYANIKRKYISNKVLTCVIYDITLTPVITQFKDYRNDQ